MKYGVNELRVVIIDETEGAHGKEAKFVCDLKELIFKMTNFDPARRICAAEAFECLRMNKKV